MVREHYICNRVTKIRIIRSDRGSVEDKFTILNTTMKLSDTYLGSNMFDDIRYEQVYMTSVFYDLDIYQGKYTIYTVEIGLVRDHRMSDNSNSR